MLNPFGLPQAAAQRLEDLYTTVNLLGDVGRRESAPVPARLCDLLRDGKLLDLVRLHEELQEESGRRVPSDVATVILSARAHLRMNENEEREASTRVDTHWNGQTPA